MIVVPLLDRGKKAKLRSAMPHLEEMIREEQFRSDLYYRLNVSPIYIPPLRERRPEDIPLLVRHFVHDFARRMNKTIDGISSETMDALTRYPWPVNIRELQNVIERSVVVHKIDAASAEAEDRVSGPSGAAALLGIAPSPLESKILSMNINKHSFKTSARTSSRTSQIHEPIEVL